MIEVINLTKSFGKKPVLNNFNAVFKQGMTCLMGDSGVGKTTLVNLIVGLIKPDSGEIRGVQGKVINCVFQENRLIEELSAMKNVMFVCNKKMKEEIYDLLVQMGLGNSINCPVSTLSGGMKRRVALARALINPADIYIFDEPFKGLDDARKDSIIDIIKKRTNGAISVLITHDNSETKMLGAKTISMTS